jgi:cysteine desulfurase/selenocysteine lyase
LDNGLHPQTVRQEYVLAPDVLYLNHASIGTVPTAVLEALRGYLELCETNPWLYIWSNPWQEPREEVRRKAARLLRCSPGELAITHNTTEGFNVLAQGLPIGPGDEVLFSSLNHAGASVCWHHLARTRGFRVRSFDFPIRDVPVMTLEDVLEVHDRAISPATRVLVFPHIDNIVGLRHPIKEMTRMARARGVEFVAVDGAQSAGMIPIDLDQSGVDFFATSPHKWIQSPKGLGLFYVRKDLRDSLRPMWVTWGQQRWAGTARIFEDYGTRDLPEVLALGDALTFQETLGESRKVARYRAMWEDAIGRARASADLEWRSPTSWDLAGSLVSLSRRDASSQELSLRLYRDHGVVVRAFQLPDLDALRVSPNVVMSDEDLDRFFFLLTS